MLRLVPTVGLKPPDDHGSTENELGPGGRLSSSGLPLITEYLRLSLFIFAFGLGLIGYGDFNLRFLATNFWWWRWMATQCHSRNWWIRWNLARPSAFPRSSR
jgi:hypothetical protein